jgi:hypothetical protein
VLGWSSLLAGFMLSVFVLAQIGIALLTVIEYYSYDWTQARAVALDAKLQCCVNGVL